MDFNVNLNSNVKVKLTPYGEQILRERHKELYELDEWFDWHSFNIPLDSEGYYVTQMWMLMNEFGHAMGMAHKLPFDMNVIMTKGEAIDGTA